MVLMARRHYDDNAPTTTITTNISNASTSFAVGSLVGFPTTLPWTGTLGLSTASSEQVLVTGVVGTTLTVTRNINGQGAFSHTSGENFNHTAIAMDFDEANNHVNSSTNVHGITGTFVDTNSVQTLTNKIISGATASTFATASGVAGATVTTDNDATASVVVKNHAGSAAVRLFGNGQVAASDVATATVEASGNATVGGTLGVTGATTLGTATVGTLHATDVQSVTEEISGNATVGGTLGVTGNTTMVNATATGTLGVTGASTLHATTATTVHATSTLTVDSTSQLTGDVTMSGKLNLGGVSDILAAYLTPVTAGSPGTVQTGFTDGGSFVKTLLNGKYVYVRLLLTSTGTITPSSGNISPDKLVYILGAGLFPDGVCIGSYSTGIIDGAASIDPSTGQITLLTASGVISPSDNLKLSFSFIRT